MLNMTKGELTKLLEHRLLPLKTIQKHDQKYFSKWDRLITAVAWLLRKDSVWDRPRGGGEWKIPYDFVPYQDNSAYSYRTEVVYKGADIPIGFEDEAPPSAQEKETIETLQRYFQTVLENVGSILNICFEHRKLRSPSTGSRDPKIRLLFCRESENNGGSCHLPGVWRGGGDIRIYLRGRRSSVPSELDSLQKTLVHELGHALGLEHMQENKGDHYYEVRGYRILSPPPEIFIGNTETWPSKPIYHKYSNVADTLMCYDRCANITAAGFKIDGHFGYIDYLALLCVYGPNPKLLHYTPNPKSGPLTDREFRLLKNMTVAYWKEKLSHKAVTPAHYEIIEKTIPERVIEYKKIRPGQNNTSTFRIHDESFLLWEKHTLRLNGNTLPNAHEAKVDGTGQRVLLYTDMRTYVDGLAGYTQVSSGYNRKSGYNEFEVVFSPTTSISALRGSPEDDVIIFGENNIEYVSGRGGADTYCFYKDKWGVHRIKERQKYGTPNYVVLCQLDFDHLRLYRWQDDLFIYDGRRFKEKNIRLINYFLPDTPNDMYRILAISKKRLFGVDNIPCFHHQFVNIVSQFKTKGLKQRQHIAFAKSLQCKFYDRHFLYRLKRRLIRYGCEYFKEVDSDYREGFVKVDFKNKYGIVVRLHDVPHKIEDRILGYRRSKNDRDLLIAWKYNGRVCGFRVLDFFKSKKSSPYKDATPLHLVDDRHNHLLSFKGMNGYGPAQAVDPYEINKEAEWYKVRFPRNRISL